MRATTLIRLKDAPHGARQSPAELVASRPEAPCRHGRKPAALPRSRGYQLIGLVQLNVWIDVVFTVLYVIIIVALSCHFLGNILTGRAKRRFVDWEWPHHEGGPIPAAPKFMHFQHVAAMIALGVSGMYIRFPFFDGGRTAMRWVHYIAMIIVIVNLIVAPVVRVRLRSPRLPRVRHHQARHHHRAEGHPLLHLREAVQAAPRQVQRHAEGDLHHLRAAADRAGVHRVRVAHAGHPGHQHVAARAARRLVARCVSRLGRHGRLVHAAPRTTSSTGSSSS